MAAVLCACVVGTGCAAALAALHRALRLRKLWRPYTIRDLSATDAPRLADPQAELAAVVSFIQDVVVKPIDKRLPGWPFEWDLHSFPFTPMVLLIGNHSSGKSTLVNKLMGLDVQETGVAPTDDGFTILERRGKSDVEDGPTVLGCPENRPFQELQRFGQSFTGHLRRKRIVLPESSVMPFGLQIVDTPGMIDLPANAENAARGRGYNFIEVVRWWAKRADLILLLFDPDKPGTTGETLEVLTKSLAGLNHKFLVVLNKVDKLDNSIDFARAYGALGWALSKVIKRKDIPQIYTTYSTGFDGSEPKNSRLPLEAFAKKRQEVTQEILRVRERHNDNIITSLEETLRQISMVGTVLTAVRDKVRRKVLKLQVVATVSFVVPALVIFQVWRILGNSKAAAVEAPPSGWGFRAASRTPPPPVAWALLPGVWTCIAAAVVYGLFCLGMTAFLLENLRQYEKFQMACLDTVFEEAYSSFFIHDDGEDYKSRWQVVQPRVLSSLKAVSSLALLPQVKPWELARIHDVLENDVWYLRQIARQIRSGQTDTVP